MRNKQGLTVFERITRDLEIAEAEQNADNREMLAHMAVAAAELAIEYSLITFVEWNELTARAFAAM